MKIERLNENQIRCTLNKSDLASRQLKMPMAVIKRKNSFVI